MKRLNSLKPWLKACWRFIKRWAPEFLVSLLASLVAALITNWLFYKPKHGNSSPIMPAVSAE